jgi:hypothetical protein
MAIVWRAKDMANKQSKADGQFRGQSMWPVKVVKQTLVKTAK